MHATCGEFQQDNHNTCGELQQDNHFIATSLHQGYEVATNTAICTLSQHTTDHFFSVPAPATYAACVVEEVVPQP